MESQTDAKKVGQNWTITRR